MAILCRTRAFWMEKKFSNYILKQHHINTFLEEVAARGDAQRFGRRLERKMAGGIATSTISQLSSNQDIFASMSGFTSERVGVSHQTCTSWNLNGGADSIFNRMNLKRKPLRNSKNNLPWMPSRVE